MPCIAFSHAINASNSVLLECDRPCTSKGIQDCRQKLEKGNGGQKAYQIHTNSKVSPTKLLLPLLEQKMIKYNAMTKHSS